MGKVCECGGSLKRGILGQECSVCGRIVDGEHTVAPCANGERVASVNRCISSRIEEDKASDVYYHLACNHTCTMDSQCPGFKPNPEYKVEAFFGHGVPPLHFCQYLDNAGNCVQPIFDLKEDGDIKPDTMRNITIGRCPYIRDNMAQQHCSIAMPDPSWPASTYNIVDDYMSGVSKAASIVISHWNDVREKAIELRDSGKVHILTNDKDIITANVDGEHGTYEVVLNRQDPYGWVITTSSCTCKWGDWQWKRPHDRTTGRMCSHEYATLMEAQAEKMVGTNNNLYEHMYASTEKCAYCDSHENLRVIGEEQMCDDCYLDTLKVAAQEALGGNDTALAFLDEELSKEGAFNLLLDWDDEQRDLLVNGRSAHLLFLDNSGKYAQIEYDEGGRELVPVESVTKVAQSMTTNFRTQVQHALQSYMEDNPVENLVVRFSDHWSQRVTGDFQSNDVPYSYEYTKSTGRVVVNEMVTGGYDKPQVEGYTKEATRFYSHSEQSELQHESLGQHARNFDRLNTDGTHYRIEDIEDEDSVDPSRLFSI